MANWAELPYDLLDMIAKRIKWIGDFIVFGAVCTSWRAATEKFDVIPLLLMQLVDKDADYREYYSLSEKKAWQIIYPLEPSQRWLCTVAVTEIGEMNLLHPSSRTQIQLPPWNSSKDFETGEDTCDDFVYKAILSASPSDTSIYGLLVCYCANFKNYLAFWQPGDMSWTVIEQADQGAVDIIEDMVSLALGFSP